MHGVEPSAARSRRRRLPMVSACAVLALAAPGVLAARASAAAIVVPAKCVVNTNSIGGSLMLVQGSGFTPGDLIELQTNKGFGFGSAPAGVNGSFVTTMTAPVLATPGPGEATFTLTARDSTTPLAVTPTASFVAANLAVATKPLRAKPGQKVTYTFSGFVSGAPIYAHYLHHNKVRATQRFGRAHGPCGTLKKKAKLYPSHQRFSSYRVQFDDSRHYSRTSLPRWVTTLFVFNF